MARIIGKHRLLPMTDWTDYSALVTIPTGPYGTVSNLTYQGRRVGDSLQIRGSFKLGSVGGSIPNIPLPTGLSINTAKFPVSGNQHSLGVLYIMESANQNLGPGNLICSLYYDTAAGLIYLSDNTVSFQFNSRVANAFLGTGDVLSLIMTVPISGWSAQDIIP